VRAPAALVTGDAHGNLLGSAHSVFSLPVLQARVAPAQSAKDAGDGVAFGRFTHSL